jgi:hypothetical protein
MAPEFPIDLIVLDLRFDNGELVGSVHRIERDDNARKQRLRVTWNVTSAPNGFFPIAGGAVYVAKDPPSELLPSYDIKPDALGKERHGWSFNTHTNTELMLVLVFPDGYAPKNIVPHPERAWEFEGRVVAYWISVSGNAEVEWTLEPLQSVAKEVIQINQKAVRNPHPSIGTLDLEGRTTIDLPTILLGTLTLAFLMVLIFFGPKDLPSDYKPLVRAIAALASGLLAGLFTGRLRLEGRLPAIANGIAGDNFTIGAVGGFAVFVFVWLFWAH